MEPVKPKLRHVNKYLSNKTLGRRLKEVSIGGLVGIVYSVTLEIAMVESGGAGARLRRV